MGYWMKRWWKKNVTAKAISLRFGYAIKQQRQSKMQHSVLLLLSFFLVISFRFVFGGVQAHR